MGSWLQFSCLRLITDLTVFGILSPGHPLGDIWVPCEGKAKYGYSVLRFIVRRFLSVEFLLNVLVGRLDKPRALGHVGCPAISGGVEGVGERWEA